MITVPREPQYETRWQIVGTRISFTLERHARAFALPHQTVAQIRRRILDLDDTLEFVITPIAP